jgi:hypothetical protein
MRAGARSATVLASPEKCDPGMNGPKLSRFPFHQRNMFHFESFMQALSSFKEGLRLRDQFSGNTPLKLFTAEVANFVNRSEPLVQMVQENLDRLSILMQTLIAQSFGDSEVETANIEQIVLITAALVCLIILSGLGVQQRADARISKEREVELQRLLRKAEEATTAKRYSLSLS